MAVCDDHCGSDKRREDAERKTLSLCMWEVVIGCIWDMPECAGGSRVISQRVYIMHIVELSIRRVRRVK